MKPIHKISRFEHDKLIVGDEKFERKHLRALLKLNTAHDFSYFDAISDGIKFKQFVGVIQVDNLSIEILPKADKDDDNGKWQNVLIEMLKACHKLEAETYGDAHVKRHRLNLLDIYFQSYLNELEILIRQGLVKKYRKERSNVTALKGKLLFSQHIAKNSTHAERFFTEHQVYDKDHLLHRILKAALNVVDQFTQGGWLSDKCKRVQLNYPEIEETLISHRQLTTLKLNRKTQPYTRAFELAKLILLNYSPDVKTGQDKIISLLFDMNKLWEEYVFISLRNALSKTEYEVTEQERKDFWGWNYLQPDIVIENTRTNERIIVDTKWKRPANSSASTQDLQQMYAYCRFWQAKKSVLLYPGESKNEEYEMFLGEHDPEHYCKLAFVNVVNEDGKLNRAISSKICSQIF